MEADDMEWGHGFVAGLFVALFFFAVVIGVAIIIALWV